VKSHDILDTPEQLPKFENESEEAEFWATHELSGQLLEQMTSDDIPANTRPRTRPIAVRFSDDLLRRLKALAKRKGVGYQTLLKEFVLERLYEEEKRERLVG